MSEAVGDLALRLLIAGAGVLALPRVVCEMMRRGCVWQM